MKRRPKRRRKSSTRAATSKRPSYGPVERATLRKLGREHWPRWKASRFSEPLIYNPRRGKWERDEGKRPRRAKGAAVNASLPEPRSPGRWVGPDSCKVCGEDYRRWHPGIGWEAAEDQLRQANAATGGGYRSRGAILWSARVLKLSAWYARHLACGEWARLRLPTAAVHAFLFGDEAARVDAWEDLRPRQQAKVAAETGWSPPLDASFPF
ncbi:MAG: hypothetical protein GY772_28910 [bacterium]|nr:hypothetical protein [bacterium]